MAKGERPDPRRQKRTVWRLRLTVDELRCYSNDSPIWPAHLTTRFDPNSKTPLTFPGRVTELKQALTRVSLMLDYPQSNGIANRCQRCGFEFDAHRTHPQLVHRFNGRLICSRWNIRWKVDGGRRRVRDRCGGDSQASRPDLNRSEHLRADQPRSVKLRSGHDHVVLTHMSQTSSPAPIPRTSMGVPVRLDGMIALPNKQPREVGGRVECHEIKR